MVEKPIPPPTPRPVDIIIASVTCNTFDSILGSDLIVEDNSDHQRLTLEAFRLMDGENEDLSMCMMEVNPFELFESVLGSYEPPECNELCVCLSQVSVLQSQVLLEKCMHISNLILEEVQVLISGYSSS